MTLLELAERVEGLARDAAAKADAPATTEDDR